MTNKKTSIERAKARQNAHVILNYAKEPPEGFPAEGSVWEAPVDTRLEDYFRAINPDWIPTARPPGGDDSYTLIAAIVNGRLRELSFPIKWDARVQPVFLQDGDGLRIYRRALSLVLIVAASELFPERKITIDHSLPFGGYYCYVANGESFNEDELEQIKALMHQIVSANEPIRRIPMGLAEARAHFAKNGDDDKVRLLKSRQRNLMVYKLRGVKDYFYGYLVPSAGYLTVFDLQCDGDGFLLLYPRRHEPQRLQEIKDIPKLRAVFTEQDRWLSLMNVPDVGALNEANRTGRLAELILVAEALHESGYADIADAIQARPDVRLVLIAGPSSSGKTTSSKRLSIQLLAHGLKPFTLGMDNYFVDRDKTPLDADGEYDFEHLHALDLDLFNQQLLDLMDGKEVQLPDFNFHTGMQGKGDLVQLTPDHIVIVEGIHALNPELVHAIPDERVFRLYVSCLTQLNIDRHNRVPTTDVRLLRRIVRDAAFRGYTALDTLTRWASVRTGERKWIFHYQENADIMFNSALVYELAVLKPLAMPLLLQVDHGSPFYLEAKRLMSFLNWVEPFTQNELIPDNSVLREFVGGSIMRNYTPGHARIIATNGTDEQPRNGIS